MGLLDSAPRSATAVSLSDDTVLERIAESDFQAFFDENPELLLSMLQQMSSRLRRITRDYAGACRTVADVVEAEKAGQDFSDALRHRIAKTLAGYESAASSDDAHE
jgi:CRP-like cAMP-binding protein